MLCVTIVVSVQKQTREDAHCHSLAVACPMGDSEARLLVDYSCSDYTLAQCGIFIYSL